MMAESDGFQVFKVFMVSVVYSIHAVFPAKTILQELARKARSCKFLLKQDMPLQDVGRASKILHVQTTSCKKKSGMQDSCDNHASYTVLQLHALIKLKIINNAHTCTLIQI